jgi:hypothetical protein
VETPELTGVGVIWLSFGTVGAPFSRLLRGRCTADRVIRESGIGEERDDNEMRAGNVVRLRTFGGLFVECEGVLRRDGVRPRRLAALSQTLYSLTGHLGSEVEFATAAGFRLDPSCITSDVDEFGWIDEERAVLARAATVRARPDAGPCALHD